jgi:hypothetical protein
MHRFESDRRLLIDCGRTGPRFAESHCRDLETLLKCGHYCCQDSLNPMVLTILRGYESHFAVRIRIGLNGRDRFGINPNRKASTTICKLY